MNQGTQTPPSAPHPPPRLARLHASARGQPWLHRFTLANRLLLAMAFLPSGLVKASGQRFTTLPLESPVGFFFEAMYRTGPYWHFIGVCQIAAALFLLLPSTATLGALLFLPIIVSIVLITWGVGFTGTVWVTSAMLLSVVYLLCWDADRLWAAGWHVVSRRRGPPLLTDADWVERSGWILGGSSGMALLLVTRGFLPRETIRGLVAAAGLAFGLVAVGWLRGMARRRGRRQRHSHREDEFGLVDG